MAVNAKFDPNKAVDLSGKKIEGGPQGNTTPVQKPVSNTSAVKGDVIQQVGAEGPKNTGTVNSQVPEVLPSAPTPEQIQQAVQGAQNVSQNADKVAAVAPTVEQIQQAVQGAQNVSQNADKVAAVAPTPEQIQQAVQNLQNINQALDKAEEQHKQDVITGTGLTPDMVTSLPTPEQIQQKIEADKAAASQPAVPDTPVTEPPVTLPSGANGPTGTNTGANANVPTTLPSTGNAPSTGTVAPSVPTTLPSANDLTASLKGTMSDWRDTVNKQQQAKIDYAVQQAVAELQRAEQDAQGQFKEQAESVAIDERQGMDNAALYAEARGDKGGIGAAQYNAIQAAAAQNRLSVQQAQTKLSTDTARQIADLRAKGEFDKADALLEVSQTYLTQLMQLEQWAANYGLDVEKFNQSLDQWQKEYDLALEKFGYQKAQDSKQSATELGMAMLNAGIPLDEATRQAMGLSKAQTDAMYAAAQMGATQTSNGELGSFSNLNEMYNALRQAGVNTEAGVIAQLRSWGVSYPSDFSEAYLDWYDSQGGGSTTAVAGQITRGMYDQLDIMSDRSASDAELYAYIESLNISDADKNKLLEAYGVGG